METHHIAPQKDLTLVIADLNRQLDRIGTRLSVMEGNAGVPASLNNDLNLNGHRIVNHAGGGRDPHDVVTYADLSAAVDELITNLPALITADAADLTKSGGKKKRSKS